MAPIAAADRTRGHARRLHEELVPYAVGAPLIRGPLAGGTLMARKIKNGQPMRLAPTRDTCSDLG
jgi:hypothetical protein